MKTATELRDELADVYADLRSGKIKPQIANELANIGGKMTASAVAQVQYYKQRNERPNIAFLNEE